MYCRHCGQQIEDGSKFCTFCGTVQSDASAAPAPENRRANPGFQTPSSFSTSNARTYSQPRPATYTPPQPVSYTPPQAAPYTPPRSTPQPAPYTPPQPNVPANAPQYVVNNNYYQVMQQPARRLPTNRGLAKFILLNFVTFGIYYIVFFTNISTSINTAASRYDGRKTMHFCLVFFLFSWLTLGIVPLIWFSKMSGRVGDELRRRGIYYSFGAGTFWLWDVLGTVILCGPFIYLHKLSKAMNLISEDFNMKG